MPQIRGNILLLNDNFGGIVDMDARKAHWNPVKPVRLRVPPYCGLRVNRLYVPTFSTTASLTAD